MANSIVVEKCLLKDIVRFENGKGHENVVSESGKYILLTSKAISTNLKSYRKTNMQLVPLYKNDIAMVMSDLPNGRALAKCFLVDKDDTYTLNQRVCRLTVETDKVLPKYLFYYLNRNKQLLEYDNGIDQTNLKKSDILDIEIIIPNIDTQREIVSSMEKLEKMEETLENSLFSELECRTKQYDYWCEKLLVNDKKSIYKLKDVADIYLGLTHTPKYVDNGIKFISSLNISKDYLDLENVKYISEEEYESITSNAKPQRNDILFVRVGSNLGHPVIFDSDEKVCIFVSVGFLRVKKENVYNKYLRYWMSSRAFMDQVLEKTKNTPKANLNTTWMKEFYISIPSLEKQKEIVEYLEKYENLMNKAKTAIPLEIELRKKQYEYLKNNIFSFEEVSNG